MNKQIPLFVVLFLISKFIFAQVTNQGEPISWKLNNKNLAIKTHILPEFDLKKLQEEDKINDTKAMPWRFGYKHDISLGFDDGQWTTLENGDRIWTIKIKSEGALSMNVVFDEFYMPEGANLYLYNDDRSDLLGAYTSVQNQKSNSLGTWLVQGETLWIEYYEPKEVLNQGKLHIESITHGYRNAKTYQKALGDSGACNQDVDCPIGSDWESQRDLTKKSVALLISGGSSFCTGALVNNTANDQTPYFLTADHCYSNPATWSFRFGWISPNPVCATGGASANGPTTLTISGASLKARHTNSDFALLEINSPIPASWDRTWAGWDNSDNDPTFVVGIHHPRGDIMKICRDDSGVIKAVNGGAQTWEITTAGGGWELGVTEPGSSGSPLFDQDGKIIGQLYGGAAACSGVNDNNQFDYYGRFAISWDAIAGSTNQLKPWLDPNNTGQTSMDSYPAPQSYTLDATLGVDIPAISCGETEINPILTIVNNGTTTLTSATVVWNLNGGGDTTINWTGSLAQYTTEDISLGTITLASGTHQINATISNPNNGTDENPNNDTALAEITIQSYDTTQVHLNLIPDDYGAETSWTFKDSSGTTLYSGGPYTNNDSTPINESFDVSIGQCYTFEILDSYGDGICCAYGNGSYTLTADDSTVIFSGASFTDSEITEISINASASTNSALFRNILIFPNPANNNLNINLNNITGNFKYSMVNTLGQEILKGNLSNSENAINVSNLDNGIYFLKINDVLSNNSIIKKIVIK